MISINVKTSLGSILRSTLAVDQAVYNNNGYAFLCESDGLHSAVYFHKEARKQGLVPVIGVELVSNGDMEIFKVLVFAKNSNGYSNLVKLVTACRFDEVGIRSDMNFGGYDDLVVVYCGKPYHKSMINCDTLYEGFNTQQVCMYTGSDEERHLLGILTALRYNTNISDVVGGIEGHCFADVKCGNDDIFYSVFCSEFELYDLPHSTNPIPSSGISVADFSMLLYGKLHHYLTSVFLDSNDKTYNDRLDYELGVINKFGYLDYFLMVYDIIRHCNEMLSGYYSAGRGSVGGSLVAFLLGITRVDPVRPMGFDMGIPFDRFLNSGRKTLPDIDIDFCPKDRAYVIEYLRFKYGVDNVMNIGTVNTLGSKSAIRDVARVLGILTPEIEQILRSFPKDQHLTLDLVEGSDVYTNNINNKDFVKLFQIAKQLEGMPRSRGVHASGIAVSTRVFDGFIPVSQSDRVDVLQYDNESLEAVGVVKFDILGLNTLQNMSDAMRYIGVSVEDLMNVPIDDAETFKLINGGMLAGVFQWDTYNYKRVIQDLKPNSFKELVDLNTLGRSAALLSGLTDSYIKRKNGQEPVEPIHPILAGVMAQTYELPLYQEQIMQLFVYLADYTMSEADDVRKAIGKKIPELMEKQKSKFSERCITKGLSIDEVAVIWEKIDKFSKYTWNLGHAVAYTRICYETAYLATHFPSQYYAACATNAKDADEAYGFINAMKQRDVPVMSADINESSDEMSVLHDGVRLGLSGIKRVGDSALNHIFAVRSSGKFNSIRDFYKRTKGRSVTTATLKSLYCAGAFDLMPDVDDFHNIIGITKRESDFLRLNQYAVSSRISTNPEKYVKGITRLYDIVSTGIVVCYVISVKEIYTKSKHELMAFLKLEDISGCYEVVAFPVVWSRFKYIKEGEVVKAIVDKDKNGGMVLKFVSLLSDVNFDSADVV